LKAKGGGSRAEERRRLESVITTIDITDTEKAKM
jgi:hypothetical protein